MFRPLLFDYTRLDKDLARPSPLGRARLPATGMTKFTQMAANEDEGASRRRIHLREISGDSDNPLETVGQDLRAARIRRGDDLAAVSRALKIRKDHLAARFKTAGAHLETFRYRRVFGETESIPDVIETAFAWCPEGPNDRRIITGVNWSPARQTVPVLGVLR